MFETMRTGSVSVQACMQHLASFEDPKWDSRFHKLAFARASCQAPGSPSMEILLFAFTGADAPDRSQRGDSSFATRLRKFDSV